MLPLLAAACHRPQTAGGPIEAAVIGPDLRWAEPGRAALDAPAAALAAATAQGLVRFDAAGEVRPGLAQRWALSDDGLDLIFRVKPVRTPLGATIDARLVAARLNAARRMGSSNPLRRLLGAIDEVIAVTDEVVEIRLASPRPNLLQLLAQPDLAIARARVGGGPFAATPIRGGVRLQLRDDALPLDGAPPVRPVILHGLRPSLAIVRFRAGRTALVLGGDAAAFPLVALAGIPADAVRVDPVAGLFGLAFRSSAGPLGDPRFRAALAMALDRDAITAAGGPRGWRGETRLVPGGLDDFASPSDPDWQALSIDERRDRARALVAAAIGPAGPRPVLRVALPSGPGADRLFARIVADWGLVGVSAIRAVAGEAPDLALVDSVAAADSAAWYLRQFTCDLQPVCDAAADAALLDARAAPTLTARTASFAVAERALSAQTAFIPIAAPLRWSLASPGLTGFATNRRGSHPLAPIAGLK